MLLLHLNRFEREAGQTHKVRDPIHAPDLLRLPTGEAYRLCATVRHHGDTPRSGRYVTAAAVAEGQAWLLYDDAHVPIPLSAHDEETQHAYLLAL